MIKPRRVAWHDQEWRKEWHRQHPPYSAAEPTIPQLCTCPRCGNPAQRETAPSGESYTTCGHCAAVVLDATGESLTMDETVRLAISMGGVPPPDQERHAHRAGASPAIDIPSVLEVEDSDPAMAGGVWVTGECWEETGAPDQDTLREWAREDEGPNANTCHNCAGAHPTWRCPGPQNDVCWSCGDQLTAPTYGPALCGACQEAGERWPEIKPALGQHLSAR